MERFPGPQTKRPPLARTLINSAAAWVAGMPRQAGAATLRCPTVRGWPPSPARSGRVSTIPDDTMRPASPLVQPGIGVSGPAMVKRRRTMPSQLWPFPCATGERLLISIAAFACFVKRPTTANSGPYIRMRDVLFQWHGFPRVAVMAPTRGDTRNTPQAARTPKQDTIRPHWRHKNASKKETLGNPCVSPLPMLYCEHGSLNGAPLPSGMETALAEACSPSPQV